MTRCSGWSRFSGATYRAAGAIFIGKTNTPEFGAGSQTYNPIFGTTGSACNPALTAGGSSGGAGSAVGTRMVPVADGSDMLGSLRNPGAFNHVVSFRPSTNGLSASGPMGRNTADMVHLLQTMAANPIGPVDAPAQLQDLSIGWLGNLNNYLPIEAGIIELCESGSAALSGAGAMVDATTPDFDMSDLWQCSSTSLHLAGDNANLTDLYLYFLPESAINLVWPMSGRVRPTMSARGSSSRPKNSHACTMSWRG